MASSCSMAISSLTCPRRRSLPLLELPLEELGVIGLLEQITERPAEEEGECHEPGGGHGEPSSSPADPAADAAGPGLSRVEQGKSLETALRSAASSAAEW